jgi:hypothetical protein
VCSWKQYQGQGTGHAAVTVDANPTGLVSTWLPGVNSRACTAITISSGRAVATAIANEIRAAPLSSPAARNCPAVDGAAVQLVFSYSSPAPELAVAELTGCAAVRAPGRSPRDVTEALRSQLNTIAPPEWRLPRK